MPIEEIMESSEERFKYNTSNMIQGETNYSPVSNDKYSNGANEMFNRLINSNYPGDPLMTPLGYPLRPPSTLSYPASETDAGYSIDGTLSPPLFVPYNQSDGNHQYNNHHNQGSTFHHHSSYKYIQSAHNLNKLTSSPSSSLSPTIGTSMTTYQPNIIERPVTMVCNGKFNPTNEIGKGNVSGSTPTTTTTTGSTVAATALLLNGNCSNYIYRPSTGLATSSLLSPNQLDREAGFFKSTLDPYHAHSSSHSGHKKALSTSGTVTTFNYPLYQEFDPTEVNSSSVYKRILHWDIKYTLALSLIIIFLLLGITVIILLLRTLSFTSPSSPTSIPDSSMDPSLTEMRSPCDSISCPNLQFCAIDNNGSPLCTCKTCSSHINPVLLCATDNTTYYSECDIERVSCLKNEPIAIKHHGPCTFVDTSIKDPCAFVVCNYGAVCIPQDSKDVNELCQCPYCEDSGPSVCGSDGITYSSQCSLSTACCTEKRYITVRYDGPCQTCLDMNCMHYSVCEIDLETSKAHCVCPKVCIRDDRPVCGSNGKTYESECELQMASCHLQINLTVAHHGSCAPNLCKNVDCKFDSECLEGECVCNFNCDSEPEESVCADDGLTYANQCSLRRSSCLKGRKLVSLFFGTCDEMKILMESSSDNKLFNSADGAKIINNTTPTLNTNEVVNFTPNGYNKNDSTIEPNKSQFNHHLSNILLPHNQSSNSFLNHSQHHKNHHKHHHHHHQQKSNHDNHNHHSSTFHHNQVTLTCNNFECLFGASCSYNSSGYPHCQCSFHCDIEPFQSSSSSSASFSSSSSTYLDPSLTGSSAFESDRKLIFVSSLHESLCGSDGQYYDNECQMKRESCNQQKDISIVDDKICDLQSSSVDAKIALDNFNESLNNEVNHDVPMCIKSEFGCCLDGSTQALGLNYLGCPERCFCNRRGSIGSNCDPITRQCSCKPGIGGLKCNRCEADFWGLHMAKGQDGCLPCNCNKFGSVRSDCEQTTGKCVCIPGIKGIKCDICPLGTILGLHGCTHGSIAFPRNGSCHDIQCFHGAVCVQNGNIAQCICDINCQNNSTDVSNSSMDYSIVCGSDSNTYQSECQMLRASCLHQTDIVILHKGPC
uniref:Agrin n=1 Tax=Tetranychus urticae TaxID=32264 RepID=T1JZW6_TETUR